MAKEAFALAANGGAICFLGAGFSLLATDSDNKPLPSTFDLASELRLMSGMDAKNQASLSDLAEYCESDPDLRKKLQVLLVKRLTKTKPKEFHRDILSIPWRSIFTTNFDDVVEMALPESRIDVFTPSLKPAPVLSGKTPLYYLHGRALDILQKDTPPSLVLSETNYLNMRDENRTLFSRLTNDISCARAIILVGYSIRDLDIARAFFVASEDIKNKTYIFCAPDEDAVGMKRLSKFGTVIPIGTESASKYAKSAQICCGTSIETFSFIDEYKPSSSPSDDIEMSDVERLIISGSFDTTKFEQQILDSSGSSLYCVERKSSIQSILDSETQIRRFIVTSNLGNGKSLFLEQLAYRAFRRGMGVYRISTNINEIYAEIERVCEKQHPYLFIIDDVVRYRTIAKFIGVRLNSLGVLVCTTRSESEHSVFDIHQTDLGGAITEISLDNLDDGELAVWDALLERWGLWESRVADPTATRIRFLKRDCGGENRAIVLSVFRNSKIAEKIDNIVSYFLKHHPQHEKAFVAILISSLCQQHVRWSNVVDWCQIDEFSLKNDVVNSEVFDFLQKTTGSWHLITSSQLAAHILNTRGHQIAQQTIVDVYTKIVRETAYSANDSRSGLDYRENLKELMRYRFLTRLFGESGESMPLIASVYKKLSSVEKIRQYDQFWLQYAMSRLEAGDVENAERYLNVALGIARSKGEGYSPHQIIDQLVRLLFQKNSITKDRFNRREIDDAIRYMRDRATKRDQEVIFQLRAVPHIHRFVERHADDIDNSLRLALIDILEQILVSAKSGIAPGAKKGELKSLKDATQIVLRVLRYI